MQRAYLPTTLILNVLHHLQEASGCLQRCSFWLWTKLDIIHKQRFESSPIYSSMPYLISSKLNKMNRSYSCTKSCCLEKSIYFSDDWHCFSLCTRNLYLLLGHCDATSCIKWKFWKFAHLTLTLKIFCVCLPIESQISYLFILKVASFSK